MLEQQQYYSNARPILVAVDCLIFGFDVQENKLKLLLIRRKLEPFKDQWSLVGSFVRPEEDVDMAAKRVLLDATGLKRPFLDQLKVYGKADRDPGGRVITIAYWSLIKTLESDFALLKEHDAAWISLSELPQLVLDHRAMVDDAIDRIQDKAEHKPIGFELLPPKFTLPKLLQLYREIYQSEIDDRNFRKKILATGLLDRLEEKDKSESRKGAFLYKFNERKYKQYLKQGLHISFS